MPEPLTVYLAVSDSGIFRATFDAAFADSTARNVEGVVVAVPAVADYRAANTTGSVPAAVFSGEDR